MTRGTCALFSWPERWCSFYPNSENVAMNGFGWQCSPQMFLKLLVIGSQARDQDSWTGSAVVRRRTLICLVAEQRREDAHSVRS
jgi:hypothetical protein